MEHSIAAKYAARPAARFVRASARHRERRLGLRANDTFRSSTSRATVLHLAHVAPLAHLRADWRAIRPSKRRRSDHGQPRPLVTMHWARSARTEAPRRSSAASAPWRA
jgi:hypothetical protein